MSQTDPSTHLSRYPDADLACDSVIVVLQLSLRTNSTTYSPSHFATRMFNDDYLEMHVSVSKVHFRIYPVG